VLAVVAGLATCLGARAADGRETATERGVRMSVQPRAPQQSLAFYEARGFPPVARERIAAACLVTVSIRNESGGVVWLEPSRWRLQTAQGRELRLHGPDWWQGQWDEIGLGAAHRATFGWTQLPASRDLQPHEPVGGNIALDPPGGPFHLEARFATGDRKQGEEIVMTFDDLVCPRDGAP